LAVPGPGFGKQGLPVLWGDKALCWHWSGGGIRGSRFRRGWRV